MYGFGGVSTVLTASSDVYYCTGTSGTVALNQNGDGCPAKQAVIRPFGGGLAVDSDGNIFFANDAGTLRVSVIYVQGSALSTLITNYYKTVYGQTVTPQVGYLYSLSGGATSTVSEFISLRSIAVDSSENIYVADNGTQATISGYLATTAGNQIKKFGSVGGVYGWTTYMNKGGTAAGTNGDGSIATAGLVNAPYCLYADKYGNLFIADSGDDKIRVVYASGTTPPLYSGSTQTVITSPVAGYVYSVAGNSTGTASSSISSIGLAAWSINFGAIQKIGMDQGGNLLLFDTNAYLWRVSASSGVGELLGGISATSTNYTAASSATPAAGIACNGTTSPITGPVMTDAYGDGCPATEVLPYGGNGNIVSDLSGNLYWLEERINTGAGAIIRKATFGGQFGTVAVGDSATSVLAFTPTSSVTTYSPTQAYTLSGGSSAEFSDAGSDTCSTITAETCIYNAKFTPTLPGMRQGSFALSASSTALGSAYVSGIGGSPLLTVDAGSTTTVAASGLTLTPSGVAVSQNGNVYLVDTTTNTLYKSASGAALAAFATGTTGTAFKSAAQVAVDGAGNVYVADAGNNRIVQLTASGTASALSFFGASGTTTALSAPAGVAVDGEGTLYVADTGNNRVLKIPALGVASTLAFSGLSSPRSVAVDTAGDVFVADSGNARIVELSASSVQSVVSISPSLVTPGGLAVDAAGDLLIADSSNQNVVILPAGSTTSSTLLSGTTGLAGLAVDASGNVLLAASGTNGLLTLNRSTPTISYAQTALGQTALSTLTLNNGGNTALTLGSSLGTLSDSTDFAVAAASTSGCSVGQSISAGGNCAEIATFQPQTTGAHTSTLTFVSSSPVTAVAALVGTGTVSTPTVSVTNVSTVQGVTSVTLTASAAYALSTAPTGAVTFVVGTGALVTATCTGSTSPRTCTATYTTSSLTAGTYTITASMAADSNYAAASGTGTLTVTTYATATLSITGTPTVSYGTSTATLTGSVAYSTGIAAPTGAVTFTVGSGSAVTATCTGSSTPLTCTASYPTSTLAVGSYTITMNIAADSQYLATSTTGTLTVTKSSVTLAVSGSPAAVYEATSTTLTAALSYTLSGTPTGAVSFLVSGGSTVAATCSGNSSPITCTASYPTSTFAAGSYPITVSYAGDGNFGATTNSSTSLTITPAATATTLTVADNLSATTPSVTLTAVVSSSAAGVTGSVTFFSGTISLGSVTINAADTATLTLTSTGVPSASLTAQFIPATTNYSGSTSAAITESSDFILSATPSTVTVAQAASATYALSLTPYFGTTSVTLACSGLPAGASCTFSPTSPVSFASGTTAATAVTLTVKTNNIATSSNQQRNLPGRGLPIAATFAACLGCVLFRRRKLMSGMALSLFCLLLLGSMTGCGNVGSSSITAVGSYPFTVTATNQSGISHNVALTLVITIDP